MAGVEQLRRWSTWWAFDGPDTIDMLQSLMQSLPVKTINSSVLFSYGHGWVRGVQWGSHSGGAGVYI